MKTDNYYLKEIESNDIVNIHKGLSDPDVTKYYAVHFTTIEETKTQMDWYQNLKEEGTGIWWGVFGIEDHQFRGACGFNGLEKEHKKAEFGLWLLKEYWGNGTFKEVIPLVFDYAFGEMNLNRIEAYVISENSNSKRALEKMDFKFEGTMRAFEIKDGKPIDVDIYAVLKRDSPLR